MWRLRECLHSVQELCLSGCSATDDELAVLLSCQCNRTWPVQVQPRGRRLRSSHQPQPNHKPKRVLVQHHHRDISLPHLPRSASPAVPLATRTGKNLLLPALHGGPLLLPYHESGLKEISRCPLNTLEFCDCRAISNVLVSRGSACVVDFDVAVCGFRRGVSRGLPCSGTACTQWV